MATKTRNYTNFVTPRPKVEWLMIYADGHTVNFSSPSYTGATRRIGAYEKITSSTGRDGSFRPCYHERHLYDAQPLTILPPTQTYENSNTAASSPFASTTINTEVIANMAYDHHSYYYNSYLSKVGSMAVSLTATQWDALASSALSTMLPSFHSGNSLVNFLLELKDFKKVVKYFVNNLNNKIDAIEAFTGARARDKTLKQLSNAYLSWSFGWSPFLQDLYSFFQTISGFKNRYDELMRRAGAPQQSYWGTTVSGTTASESIALLNGVSGDGATGGGYGPGGVLHCLVRAVTGASDGIRYSATVRYRYRMPDELRSVVGKLKAFLAVLGVERNPAIIWNAIPFSFIVDWIVDVSGYLERLRVDNIDFKTEILDFCHSAKAQRTIYYQIAQQNRRQVGGPTWTSGYSTTDSCTKTVYERRVGLPNFLLAMQTSGLNPREFSLGGALIRANMRK